MYRQRPEIDYGGVGMWFTGNSISCEFFHGSLNCIIIISLKFEEVVVKASVTSEGLLQDTSMFFRSRSCTGRTLWWWSGAFFLLDHSHCDDFHRLQKVSQEVVPTVYWPPADIRTVTCRICLDTFTSVSHTKAKLWLSLKINPQPLAFAFQGTHRLNQTCVK